MLEDRQRDVTEMERNSPYVLIAAAAADEQIGEESHSSKQTKKHSNMYSINLRATFPSSA